MTKLNLIPLLLVFPLLSFAQPQKRITVPEYIQKYKDDAIRDMKERGVPASITLAQGILESDAGNSDLAREANNHFGIKCHKEWTGEFFIKDDDTKDECFRKYKSVYESFDDHGRFLRERPRYAFLFDLEVTDYKGWAHGLKKAGYATNPRYAELLIKIIEENELYQYDRGGQPKPLAKTPPVAENKKDDKVEHEKKHARNEKTRPASKQRKEVSGSKYQTNENGVPYLIAGKNDSWYSVAVANEMRLWQILKYNDADKNDNLSEGEIVYLKPKRGRPSAENHIVKDGETLRSISQKHGVKISRLIKLNQFDDNISVTPGQKIRLR